MSDSANNVIGDLPSGGGLPSTKPGEQRFTWNFDHKMDGQKRVQFPADWRPQGDVSESRYTLVLWPHPHLKAEREFAFIMGLIPQQFEGLLKKIEAKGLGNHQVAALRRKIFHNSFELSLDPAGRLCLPPKMAAQIGLDKEVHFVGAGGHFEIWEPAAFEICTKAEANLADEAYGYLD